MLSADYPMNEPASSDLGTPWQEVLAKADQVDEGHRLCVAKRPLVRTVASA
jgi:hypothetical protein